MKSVLILRHLRVENANAIAGITYGFPAISNFLGFTHALSRAVQKKLNLTLGGCAVVCHKHHVNTHQPGGRGDYVFALTRNPLTKESKTPAFVEEGRMQMDVSLLIECDFYGRNIDFGSEDIAHDVAQFETFIRNQVLTQRLAGGTISEIGQVVFEQLPQESSELERFTRRRLLGLLPGFVLVDRSYLLKAHYQHLQATKPGVELIDAWLDFAALKYKAEPDLKDGEALTPETQATWQWVPKPGSGWLVPITTGFKAISPLYEGGEVARSRDPDTPFRFVESVYGVGEWLSPHRVRNLKQILWHYHVDGDWYLCKNNYQPQSQEIDIQTAQ